MDHPVGTAPIGSLGQEHPHYQVTSLSPPPPVSTSAGDFYPVSETAIMQALRNTISEDTLANLSLPDESMVEVPVTAPSSTVTNTTIPTSVESGQSESTASANSLANSLGLNLSNQATQMLMV